MLKTRDVSSELRNFNSLFSKFAYKYDVSSLFSDFLTIVICVFARETEEELYFETIARYKKEELTIFAKLLGELILIYEDAKQKETWVDPLGEYYEALASGSKKSGLGQFFTPPALCNVMVQLTQEPNQWDKTINEPCSGSGRIILASNHYAQGNYFVAQDLDSICCKMTAINMCLHEIRGEVHQMNALSSQKPFLSYSINYDFHKHKTPLILLKRPV